jgi:delta 1-pyrroline-5-carboxylate dehydrogenase
MAGLSPVQPGQEQRLSKQGLHKASAVVFLTSSITAAAGGNASLMMLAV